MKPIIVRIKKEDERAIIPKQQTKGAAGFDLHALEETIILSGAVKIIKTGLAVEIPPGYEGQVRPRSGLALKANVTVLNSPGTIDSDYRGEVGVILANFGPRKFSIAPGDRIAQMVIAKCPEVEIVEAAGNEQLSLSDRGDGGFGSTGVKNGSR